MIFPHFAVTTALLLMAGSVLADSVYGTKSGLPSSDLDLTLDAPITTWDEGIPLGAGMMGALIWGQGHTLRISLDRGDLWDERPSSRFTQVQSRFHYRDMQRMARQGKQTEFDDVFDSNYDYDGPPTRLPAGRLEITLDKSQNLQNFRLNLARAEATAQLSTGSVIRAFVDGSRPHYADMLVLIPDVLPEQVRLLSPESVSKLGYAAPIKFEEPNMCCFEQTAAKGFSYAICARWRAAGKDTLLAIAIATNKDPLISAHELARIRADGLLRSGYTRRFQSHLNWWAKFWERSQITIPDRRILQQYYLVRYFYGAASRRGAPPMPLQGVWTADTGNLPPWKGDYHNDLNTQMTYIAYRTSGDFDEGRCFLDYLWDRLPAFRKFAGDFYSTRGAAIPGVMSLAGNPLGGWGQYSLSPTMGAWCAHLFYLHWRHTGDISFLRNRAYPFCCELGQCLQDLLHENADGNLALPLSSSPEVFDNTLKAFLKPNTNFDAACMKMLFLSLADMAEKLGKTKLAENWAYLASRIGPFHTTSDGTLLLDASTPLPESHRHLSNLMAIHPFNLITEEGEPRDRQIIEASVKDWDSKGTQAWCGYSFSWMACLRARIGDAEAALHFLDIYARAFVLRNGFHANGDQTKSGYSSFTYRPFTLEGNFLAMEAVHEMLLQSWSPTPGKGDWGPIRAFPAVPKEWQDCEFHDLRAEGGRRVSAIRRDGRTVMVTVTAGDAGVVRIKDPFDGAPTHWNLQAIHLKDGFWEVQLEKGETVRGERGIGN